MQRCCSFNAVMSLLMQPWCNLPTHPAANTPRCAPTHVPSAPGSHHRDLGRGIFFALLVTTRPQQVSDPAHVLGLLSYCAV